MLRLNLGSKDNSTVRSEESLMAKALGVSRELEKTAP